MAKKKNAYVMHGYKTSREHASEEKIKRTTFMWQPLGAGVLGK